MMTLRPLVAILAGLSMGGCSVFSASSRSEAPLTQIGLSLYASADVNPNPDSVSPDATALAFHTPAPPALTVDPAATGGPYLLNLKSSNKADLRTQLRALLDYLQSDSKADSMQALAARVRFDPETTTSGWPDFSSPYPYYGLGMQTVALPSSWNQPKGAPIAAAEVNPPLPMDLAGKISGTPALGQYGDGSTPTLPQEPEPPVTTVVATPVAFKILQLKDDAMFLNAGYDQLAKDLKKSLGSTYIADDDYVLKPGQFKYIDYTTIDKNTRYIAVLANFHDQNGAVWKQVLRLESRGYHYALLVTFHGSEVSIVDEGYRAPPPGK